MSSNVSQKKDLSSKKSSLLKKRKNVPVLAKVVILTTFNNNIVTLTDSEGNVIISRSAGGNGFKGTRKATPYAAQVTAAEVAQEACALGVKCVNVKVRGVGSGRDCAIMALRNSGLKVGSIEVDIRIPHNGCRPRKRRKT